LISAIRARTTVSRPRSSARSACAAARRPYIALGMATITSCTSGVSSRATHGECVPTSQTTRAVGCAAK
jgi:hypothetical protein